MKRCVGIIIVLFGILSIVSGLCEPGILILPNDLTRIEEKAFYGDFNMQEAVLPEGVKYIGPLAFGYSGLTKINLPSSLEEIDDTAFEGLCQSRASRMGPAKSWRVVAKRSQHGGDRSKNCFSARPRLSRGHLCRLAIQVLFPLWLQVRRPHKPANQRRQRRR